MMLAGLGIHEVRLEDSGVEPEEGVRQRAVTPVEPGEVQAHQQLHEGVDELVALRAGAGVAEQGSIGRRVLEEGGHQDRVCGGIEVAAAVDNHPAHTDGGDMALFEEAEEAMLPLGE